MFLSEKGKNPYKLPAADPKKKSAAALQAANVVDGRAAAGNKDCQKAVAANKSQSMTAAALSSGQRGMTASYMEEEEEEIQA